MKNSQKATNDYYDKNASRWASFKTNSFYHESRFRKFIGYLKKGDTILDIGCAYGIHVPLFLGIGRNLRYEGIDASKAMIKLAKARYPQLPFSLEDISKPKKMLKRTYAGFWAAAVLMHTSEDRWNGMLRNIEGMMKKRAIGFVTLPSERPNPESKRDRRHFTLFTKKKFYGLIEPRGWKVLNAGTARSSAGELIWHWFIVRLP